MGVSGSERAATDLQRALYAAAEQATLAPSILNTQPWRWQVHRTTLELFADPRRQVHSVDPQRRLLTLSCGAALHHAGVALRVRALEPRVERAPDPTEPDLLARIHIAGIHDVSRADLAQAAATRQRHTDRRLIAARVPVNPTDLDGLRQAADGHGVQLHLISADQKRFLMKAAKSAQTLEGREEPYQHDLVAWTDDRIRGEGVPTYTLVSPAVDRPVPLRDFAGGGETGLHPGHGDDAFADYLVLATAGDEPLDWLHGGEAMSAVWLEATVRNIAVSVISDVIEVPGPRALVAALLAEPGHPLIVLRIGIAAQPTPPPASPRREPDTVITVDDRT